MQGGNKTEVLGLGVGVRSVFDVVVVVGRGLGLALVVVAIAVEAFNVFEGTESAVNDLDAENLIFFL